MAHQAKTRKPKGDKVSKPSSALQTKYPFLCDFLQQTDWCFGNLRKAFSVYALALYYNRRDYSQLAADAYTDGFDDKDIDLCHFEPDGGTLYLVQSYVSPTWEKPTGPANKAGDLLTALTWLMVAELSSVPLALRPRAQELRNALADQQLEAIHLLFIHNGKESKSVGSTLATVQTSVSAVLENKVSQVAAVELGLTQLQHRFESLTQQIVVREKISIQCNNALELKGSGWRAVCATIDAEVLHSLWDRHGQDLFSGNIRDFMDTLSRKRSVNAAILATIRDEPDRFWVYNNGVTILTNGIRRSKNTIHLDGLSIINGAQTTGAIGNADLGQVQNTKVLCRFIECKEGAVIERIVETNNTQNEIKSFDRRSREPIQSKLSAEFDQFGIKYIHRRQGSATAVPGSIQAETLAPFLAAFHGRFDIAYRQRRSIFEDRTVFDSVFNKTMTAEHVFLVQTLADAIAQVKLELGAKAESKNALEAEIEVVDLLKHAASKHFVVGMIGELSSSVFGSPVTNRFGWIVSPKRVTPDRSKVIAAWKLAVEALLPFIAKDARGEGVDPASGYLEAVRSAEVLHRVAKKCQFTLLGVKLGIESSLSLIRDVAELR
jgi:hypothetical protein